MTGFDNFLRSLTRFHAVLMLVVSVLSWRTEGGLFAGGAAVSVCWTYVNFYLLAWILSRLALSGGAGFKTVRGLILIKYPVLYLAGFLLLQYFRFPVESVILGITVSFVASGIVFLKHRKEIQGTY